MEVMPSKKKIAATILPQDKSFRFHIYKQVDSAAFQYCMHSHNLSIRCFVPFSEILVRE